ncbi:hypothetical protein [Sphingomonas sp. OTU376]|uniref:hypothetical protein n=1 Tax=Sphingomonas sp. OTU376 TaxID=3043863 RepID=UPI00313BF378
MSESTVQATALLLPPGKVIRFASTKMSKVALVHVPSASDSRRLPRLILENVGLEAITVAFALVSREQFVASEKALRNFSGILLVEDPSGDLQAFRHTHKAGATRYRGWEANYSLLLLGTKRFSQFSPEVMAKIEADLSHPDSLDLKALAAAVTILSRDLIRVLERGDGHRLKEDS